MEELKTLQALQASIADAIPLTAILDSMTKEDMIKYADDIFNLAVDPKLSKEVIRANILKIDEARRGQAFNQNVESTQMFLNRGDKALNVKFHRLDFPDADLEFSYSGNVGMKGNRNKQGFSKCPSFHLYPGETYTLPTSVINHLKSLTFATHKTVIDKVTGMIAGAIPVVKPKFILEYVFSKEQLEKLSEASQQPETITKEPEL